LIEHRDVDSFASLDLLLDVDVDLEMEIDLIAVARSNCVQRSRTAALAPLPLKTSISATCASEAMTNRPPANARPILMASSRFSPSSA
jgi:hypothetical protein